jgi:hypothetical protein
MRASKKRAEGCLLKVLADYRLLTRITLGHLIIGSFIRSAAFQEKVMGDAA